MTTREYRKRGGSCFLLAATLADGKNDSCSVLSGRWGGVGKKIVCSLCRRVGHTSIELLLHVLIAELALALGGHLPLCLLNLLGVVVTAWGVVALVGVETLEAGEGAHARI